MRERRQIGIVRLAVWGSAEDVRRALGPGDGGAAGGEDGTAEALAAFGFREEGRP